MVHAILFVGNPAVYMHFMMLILGHVHNIKYNSNTVDMKLEDSINCNDVLRKGILKCLHIQAQ